MYGCVDKTFNQWTFFQQLLLHCMIVKCMIHSCFFSSFIRSFVHRLNWRKVNTSHRIASHHITLVIRIVIQVCPKSIQATRAFHIDVNLQCVLDIYCTYFLFLRCCAQCVWHTRRKIAQTHNRKSRKMGKKHHQQQDFFYTSCIIVVQTTLSQY